MRQGTQDRTADLLNYHSSSSLPRQIQRTKSCRTSGEGDSEVSSYMQPKHTLVQNFTFKSVEKYLSLQPFEDFTIHYLSNYPAVESNARMFWKEFEPNVLFPVGQKLYFFLIRMNLKQIYITTFKRKTLFINFTELQIDTGASSSVLLENTSTAMHTAHN